MIPGAGSCLASGAQAISTDYYIPPSALKVTTWFVFPRLRAAPCRRPVLRTEAFLIPSLWWMPRRWRRGCGRTCVMPAAKILGRPVTG